ncbi:outer membrane protein assembly factor BamB family protein [Halobacterium litoreum]|uniref:PQQ-binding-like beta-propeller repeat protein n=1 Tax=Halobacterium litoreum TaxID=2039234 RepID=A0ABD5NFQ2_9EURY|nr:PQQ-binding-like beta-propeller repeat protein [Halobacterium litoreum]UHH13347.1 PQQ-binding-like beta-propeller repeat protein [Halobacterium litoreum]
MTRRLSRRALLASLGGAAATAAAGCTAPADDPDATTTTQTAAGSDAPEISLSGDGAWTTYGYDTGHSGFNPDASGVGDDPSQVWSSSVEGIYTLREPAVADGRVFVGSDQFMWAFDAATGERAWRTDLDAMAHHFAPTYRDDTLYTVAKDAGGVNNGAPGYVRALNPADGGVRWETKLPATSTVAPDGDRLYVAAKAGGSGFVRALDRADGSEGWRFDVPDTPRSTITGTPAVADGTVYVPATHLANDGSKTGALYALDPESGDVDWSVSTTAPLYVAPVVADDRVFVAARDGTIHALTPDGDTDWTVDATNRIYSRPTYADGRLFALTAGDIVAYGAGGEELWRAASDRTQMSGMTVAGDTLYVGGEPLFALDVADGSVTFDIPVDVYHGSYGAPVVVEDVLYAGICIKEQTGVEYDNYVRAYV